MESGESGKESLKRWDLSCKHFVIGLCSQGRTFSAMQNEGRHFLPEFIGIKCVSIKGRRHSHLCSTLHYENVFLKCDFGQNFMDTFV